MFFDAFNTDGLERLPIGEGVNVPPQEARAPNEPEPETPPPLNDEDAAELAAAIQLASQYAQMMAMPAWKHLSGVLVNSIQVARRDLETLTDMNDINRCQMTIQTIRCIDDHIASIFKMAAAARAHKA